MRNRLRIFPLNQKAKCLSRICLVNGTADVLDRHFAF